MSSNWSYKKAFHSIAGFWMSPSMQMTREWEAERHGRLTAGSLPLLRHYPTNLAEPKRQKLAGEVMHGLVGGVHRNPKVMDIEVMAQEAYIAQHVDLGQQRVVVPGLCVPDPHDAFYSFIPEEQRFMLLHMCASPDLLVMDYSNDTMRIVEIKCPQNVQLYPEAVKSNRPLKKHDMQCQWYMGVMGMPECDYYMFNPVTNLNIRVNNSELWKNTVMQCLDYIARYILPDAAIDKMILPPSLAGYYRERLEAWRNRNKNS